MGALLSLCVTLDEADYINDTSSVRSLKECLPRTHNIGQSPFKYYERYGELGSGSMGAVMRVNKKPEYIGGIPIYGKSKVKKKTIFGNGNKMPAHKAQSYAMKRIILEKFSTEFIDEMKNEISILRDLDHPSIVRLYEVYDVKNQMYVVMDLCVGGDLWNRVPYTEKAAAIIIKKLVSAIAHMHDNGVMHRDLKMENILFETNDPDSEIKVIDFGLSKKFRPGEYMDSRVGSFYTMAPQVLQGVYTSAADMWAVGVLAFLLLSSEKPFDAPDNNDIIIQIMKCDYNFDAPVWKSISEDAKKFIAQLIETDPEERLTAVKANDTSWLQKEDTEHPDTLDKDLVKNLHKTIRYHAGSSLMKKIGLLIIAHNSSTQELEKLRDMFRQYDKNNDGKISFEDFHDAIERFGYTDEEMRSFFDKLDVYGKGIVCYTEFLAATLETQGNIEEDRLADAFNRIDAADTGYIDKNNIRRILGKEYDQDLVDEAIKELDHDGDGRITFDEFKNSFTRTKSRLSSGSLKSYVRDSDDMGEAIVDDK